MSGDFKRIVRMAASRDLSVSRSARRILASPEERLLEALNRLAEHRQRMRGKGAANVTRGDVVRERQLTRAYQREVERCC